MFDSAATAHSRLDLGGGPGMAMLSHAVGNRAIGVVVQRLGETTDAGRIDHETIEDAPSGSRNSRQTVGVGEGVMFNAPTGTEGTWSYDAGELIDGGAEDDEVIWQAPNRATTATVTFEKRRTGLQKLLTRKKQSSVEIEALEPDSIDGSKSGSITPSDFAAMTGRSVPKQGAGMKVRFRYNPLHVSFGSVEAGEKSGPASSITGYYKTNYEDTGNKDRLAHNTHENFCKIDGSTNESVVDDYAQNWGEKQPWADGSYEWVIPNRFRVHEFAAKETGAGKELPNKVTQKHTLKSDGTMKVEKAGVEETRSVSP